MIYLIMHRPVEPDNLGKNAIVLNLRSQSPVRSAGVEFFLSLFIHDVPDSVRE